MKEDGALDDVVTTLTTAVDHTQSAPSHRWHRNRKHSGTVSATFPELGYVAQPVEMTCDRAAVM